MANGFGCCHINGEKNELWKKSYESNRPEMIELILETVNNIDLSVYKDSMSPLIKKDIEALMTVVK